MTKKESSGRYMNEDNNMPTDRSVFPNARQRFNSNYAELYSWYKNMNIPAWFDKMYERGLIYASSYRAKVEDLKKIVNKREVFALSMLKEPNLKDYHDPESIVGREIQKRYMNEISELEHSSARSKECFGKKKPEKKQKPAAKKPAKPAKKPAKKAPVKKGK